MAYRRWRIAYRHLQYAIRDKRYAIRYRPPATCAIIPSRGKRMNTRRLMFYLIVNALVSASATLAVLWLWDRAHSPPRTVVATPVTQVSSGPTAAAPTAGAQPSPIPPTPTLTVYVVQSGDPLGSIAEQFDVPVEDIMKANGLTEPDVLDVGQALVIPVGGFVFPTATPGALPTNVVETPAPTATRDPNAPLPRL